MSRFIFVVAKGDIWKPREFLTNEILGKLEIIENHSYDNSGNIIVAKSYPISEFIDEAYTKKCIEDFIMFCSESNIQLQENELK